MRVGRRDPRATRSLDVSVVSPGCTEDRRDGTTGVSLGTSLQWRSLPDGLVERLRHEREGMRGVSVKR